MLIEATDENPVSYLTIRYPSYYPGHYMSECVVGTGAKAYAKAHARVLVLAKIGHTGIKIEERVTRRTYCHWGIEDAERERVAEELAEKMGIARPTEGRIE